MLNTMRYSPIALLVACALAASAAQAAVPTITFEGEVTTQSCKVSVNGSTNTIVLLPTVKTSEFSTTPTAGRTPFTVDVTGCAEGNSPNHVGVKFNGRQVTENGNLANIATGEKAAGVAVQLTENEDGTSAIELKGVTAVKIADLTTGANADTSKIFYAQYIQEDTNVAVGAGKVTAVVEYDVTYL